MDNELHVVRADILLWTLGGFAAEDASFPNLGPKFLPRDYMLAVRRHVSENPTRFSAGVKRIAETYGRSYNATCQHVSRYRRGRLPARWDLVA